MSATATTTDTIANAIDRAKPGEFESALQKAKLGTMLTPLKKTITLAAVTAAVPLSPPALVVGTCRVSDVTGGTADAGPRVITDAGGTPVAKGAGVNGIATISDDGATLTFEGTVKAIVVEYIPRAAADITSQFVPSP